MRDGREAAARTREQVAASVNPREYDVQTLEVTEDLPRYNEWVLEALRPHLRGRVLEIGAGIGTIARGYVDQVDEAVLLEPASDLLNPLRAAVGDNPKVHVLNGTLDDVFGTTVGGVRVTDASFDAAIMVNVLEHIADDRSVLEMLHRLLKPGGAMLIFVPAVPFLYGSLDARLGHLRRYTRASLTRVVMDAGFTLDTIRYFDLLGMISWFVTGRILKASGVGSGSAKLYDRMIVPLCKLTDRVTRRPVGKNLVCIATKRHEAAR